MRWAPIPRASRGTMAAADARSAAASPPPRIAVFAKAPIPGAVKTRLVPLLGADRAARLHASLVRHALATAREAQPALLRLWCAPGVAHPFFGECRSRYGCELV